MKWQQLKLWNRFQSIFVEKHYSNRQIRDENHNFLFQDMIFAFYNRSTYLLNMHGSGL